MKKMLVLSTMFAAVLAIGLAGCGNAADSGSQASSSQESESTGASVGMPNPWSDAESAEEAAAGAGIDSFTVPEPGTKLNSGQVFPYRFSYMEGLAQADTDLGAAQICLRKGVATDTGDVSGDYNEYSCSWKQDVDGIEVSCFGMDEGRATKSIWSDGDCDYCVLAYSQGDSSLDFGLDEQDLAVFVKAMM